MKAAWVCCFIIIVAVTEVLSEEKKDKGKAEEKKEEGKDKEKKEDKKTEEKKEDKKTEEKKEEKKTEEKKEDKSKEEKKEDKSKEEKKEDKSKEEKKEDEAKEEKKEDEVQEEKKDGNKTEEAKGGSASAKEDEDSSKTSADDEKAGASAEEPKDTKVVDNVCLAMADAAVDGKIKECTKALVEDWKEMIEQHIARRKDYCNDGKPDYKKEFQVGEEVLSEWKKKHPTKDILKDKEAVAKNIATYISCVRAA